MAKKSVGVSSSGAKKSEFVAPPGPSTAELKAQAQAEALPSVREITQKMFDRMVSTFKASKVTEQHVADAMKRQMRGYFDELHKKGIIKNPVGEFHVIVQKAGEPKSRCFEAVISPDVIASLE